MKDGTTSLQMTIQTTVQTLFDKQDGLLALRGGGLASPRIKPFGVRPDSFSVMAGIARLPEFETDKAN